MNGLAASPRARTTLQRAGVRVASLLFTCVLLLSACSDDFHLSAGPLTIAPNPAVPGDEMTAAFVLNLIPGQRHTMVVYIDDEEHLRFTADGLPENPIILEIGDAADLIDAYGTGEHFAYVLIEARGERTRTDFAVFQLNAQ